MQRAFLFDLDGVIINSEQTWDLYEMDLFTKTLGSEITEKLNAIDTVGSSVKAIYLLAKSFGATISEKEFNSEYDHVARQVYKESSITPHIDRLIEFLKTNNFKIALVSASKTKWIHWALERSVGEGKFDFIVSLTDRPDLQPKPSPDGYNEAMKQFHCTPENTFILEDSNRGISSALASGAHTIAFTGNLVKGYRQIAADYTAHTIDEVIGILQNYILHNNL